MSRKSRLVLLGVVCAVLLGGVAIASDDPPKSKSKSKVSTKKRIAALEKTVAKLEKQLQEAPKVLRVQKIEVLNENGDVIFTLDGEQGKFQGSRPKGELPGFLLNVASDEVGLTLWGKNSKWSAVLGVDADGGMLQLHTPTKRAFYP